jgi:hypothetical protein
MFGAFVVHGWSFAKADDAILHSTAENMPMMKSWGEKNAIPVPEGAQKPRKKTRVNCGDFNKL